MMESFQKLAIKDLHVYRMRLSVYVITSVLLAMSLMVLSVNQIDEGVILVICMLIMSVTATVIPMDELSVSSQVFSISLPTKRNHFVIFRYLFSLLIGVGSTVILLLIYHSYIFLFDTGLPVILSAKVVLLLMIYLFIHLGIFFYSFFRLQGIMRWFVSLVSFALPGFIMIEYWRTKDNFQVLFQQGEEFPALLLLIVSGLLFYVSCVMSVRYFVQKDL